MAGRLSFSIALNLLTENFKKGANTVRDTFRSIQAQVLTFAAALGFAGVGLSSLLSDLIRVSRETSKAVTALKNVSGSTAQFAGNLSFTTQLAKKYGVYVNDLTGNFAKFTAAANIAGISMDDQRKLFESLSRASGAFGLSADETNGVFLAITQMMGKGKIQAEELRGQLGERMPIAMQAMAKAAGTTVAGLDKIMREGKLLSAEVLPKLADALNEMLPNVDTDNIETSLNRLRNAFQEFTQNTGIQDSYKNLIDSITRIADSLSQNISHIFTGLYAALAFAVVKASEKIYVGLDTIRGRADAALLNAATRSQEKVSKIYQSLQDALKDQDVKKTRVQTTQGNYNSLTAAKNIRTDEVERLKIKYLELSNAQGANAVELENARKAYQKAVGVLDNYTLKVDSAKNSHIKAVDALDKQTQKVSTLGRQYDAAKKVMIETGNAARAASSRSSIDKVLSNLTLGVARLKLALRSMWASFGPAAVISAIVALVGYFIDLYDEAKRVKNIFSDYKREVQSSGNSNPEVIQMKSLQGIMNDRKSTQDEINTAQAKLQDMLGVENKSQKDLNFLVAKRIALLKEAAKADLYARKIAEYEDKNDTLAASSDLNHDQLSSLVPLYERKGTSSKAKTDYYTEIGRMMRNNGVKGAYSAGDVDKAMTEFVENLRVINHATEELKDSQVKASELNKKTNTGGNDDDEKKKTPLQKAEESYARKIRELEVRREVEGMSVSSYNNSLDELNRSALIEARASDEKKILESDYIKKLQERVDNPVGLDAIKSGYDRLTDTLGRKNEELSSVGADMVSRFGKGNVDLLNRPVIDTTKLSEKGWKDVGDGMATVFSSSMGVEQDGKEVTVHVTPILPDGSVLSESELNDYVTNILSGTRDILESDSKKNGGLGIVLGVDGDTGAEGASAWGEELHLVQERYYDIKRQVDELNKSSERLASTYESATRQDRDEKATGIKKDYSVKKGDLDKQREANFLTEKQYEEKLRELVSGTMALTASLLGADALTDEFYQSLLSQGEKLKVPGYKERDKTFDYKRTDIEKLQSERDSRKDYVDKIKSGLGSDADDIEEKIRAAKGNLEVVKAEYGKGAADMIDALNAALTNVDSLEDALKIAEVKKDIKDLTKQLEEGLYSGVKDIASSANRLVSSFSSLGDVMNDEDATAWERIMAVWDFMINAVDAFMGIVKTIEGLTEITKKLTAAKKVEETIDKSVTATKVANATTQATASTTAATTSIVADTTASSVKKKTAMKNVSASIAEGAADSGKSAAKLPFPWNIVAIGGAIAAAIAAFALIPKFATGGIAQGSTSGDRNIIRVNGGEMILNGQQQATLFQIANGRGIMTRGLDGVVEFRHKYDQLVGVLRTGERNERRGR